jgi:hypothetical protein
MPIDGDDGKKKKKKICISTVTENGAKVVGKSRWSI